MRQVDSRACAVEPIGSRCGALALQEGLVELRAIPDHGEQHSNESSVGSDSTLGAGGVRSTSKASEGETARTT